MANEIDSNVIYLMRTAVSAGLGASGSLPGADRGQELPVGGKSVPQERENLSKEMLSSAVDNLNQYVQTIRRELQFSVDENSGRTVIKVLDAETKEVIRQIPAEEVISLSKTLGRKESLIFSQKT